MQARRRTIMRTCPRCERDLQGAADDTFVVCVGCKRAWETSVDGGELGVAFLSARGYGDGRALPFVRFRDVRATVAASAGDEAVRRVAAVETVWVLAASIRRFQGYGDVSFEYSRRPPRLERGRPMPMVRTARSLEDARRVARAVMHRIAGGADGSSLFDVHADLDGAELAYVPTVIDAGLMKLPHCPIRYPEALLED